MTIPLKVLTMENLFFFMSSDAVLRGLDAKDMVKVLTASEEYTPHEL